MSAIGTGRSLSSGLPKAGPEGRCAKFVRLPLDRVCDAGLRLPPLMVVPCVTARCTCGSAADVRLQVERSSDRGLA